MNALRIDRLAGTLERIAERLEGGAVVKRVAAAPDAPAYTTILDAALDATGLRDRWEAGTLEGRQPLDLLHAVRLEGRRWLRWAAEALLAEVAPEGAKALFGGVRAAVGGFFDRAKGYVRELFAAGVLAIAGPDPAILDAPVVQEAIKREAHVQDQYLVKFADEIVRENKPLDGTFVARVEQYGSAVWGAAQETVREAAKQARIFDEEQREHYGADRPCDTCREEIAKGWVPVGTLRAIGDSECRGQCHCAFSYRQAGGKPHLAGRGPLNPQVFGRTG